MMVLKQKQEGFIDPYALLPQGRYERDLNEHTKKIIALQHRQVPVRFISKDFTVRQQLPSFKPIEEPRSLSCFNYMTIKNKQCQGNCKFLRDFPQHGYCGGYPGMCSKITSKNKHIVLLALIRIAQQYAKTLVIPLQNLKGKNLPFMTKIVPGVFISWDKLEIMCEVEGYETFTNIANDFLK